MFPFGAILAGDPAGKYQEARKRDLELQEALIGLQGNEAAGKILQLLSGQGIPGQQQMQPGMGGQPQPQQSFQPPPQQGPTPAGGVDQFGRQIESTPFRLPQQDPSKVQGGMFGGMGYKPTNWPTAPSGAEAAVGDPYSAYNRTPVSLGGSYPDRPPGGAPSAGGPPPPVPGGGMPMQQGGGMGQGGMGQGGGPLTMQQVAQLATRALGPNANPAMIYSAVSKFVPLMNAEAQQQWHMLAQQLKMQDLQLRQQSLAASTGQQPGGQRPPAQFEEGAGGEPQMEDKDKDAGRRYYDTGTLPQGYSGKFDKANRDNAYRYAAYLERQFGGSAGNPSARWQEYKAHQAGLSAAARYGEAAPNKATSAALSEVTKNYSAIRAFGQNTIQNGRVLMQLADKIDQTGSPVLERWIRAGKRDILGDKDVNNFNFQMRSFIAEVARAIAQPRLVGALTDTARKEISEALNPGTSAAQFRALLPLIEADINRREQTLYSQMQELDEAAKRGGLPSAPEGASPVGGGPSKAIEDDPMGLRGGGGPRSENRRPFDLGWVAAQLNPIGSAQAAEPTDEFGKPVGGMRPKGAGGDSLFGGGGGGGPSVSGGKARLNFSSAGATRQRAAGEAPPMPDLNTHEGRMQFRKELLEGRQKYNESLEGKPRVSTDTKFIEEAARRTPEGAKPARLPANVNTSQEEIQDMIPPPKAMDQRLWDNYTHTMKPDEVMASEPVWSGAERIAEATGMTKGEAFAHLANGFWRRMGANRYITPDMATRYMRLERGKAAGIKSVPKMTPQTLGERLNFKSAGATRQRGPTEE